MTAKPNGSSTIESELVLNRAQSTVAWAAKRLDLPAPRIWTPQILAEFLTLSIHWVYKRSSPSAEDPIPRVAGVGRLRFDTHSVRFQLWMQRQLGCVDEREDDE